MEGITSTTFVRYILDKVDNSPAAWQRAYESLRLHPTQLSALTAGKSKSERERFINRFDRYAERFIHFLKNMQPQTPRAGRMSAHGTSISLASTEKKKSIGDIITTHLLSDLLSEPFSKLWNKDSLFELAIITLQFAHAEHLQQIACRLTKCPALLGKIVSSDKSNQLARRWVQVLSTQDPADAATLETWTEIIAESCSVCPIANSHGLKVTLAQWAQAQPVRKSLRKADPSGSRPVAVLTLQKELEATIAILSQLCSSMPCRKCFSRFRDPSYAFDNADNIEYSISESDSMQRGLETDHLGLEDELFGQGIGLWKIVLSAQALKDLKSSKEKDDFDEVWGKLQDLSTGDWIRKAVACPFKVTTGVPDFIVRLFIAYYGTNGDGILWQVDCGYDLRVQSHSQIVKVWRIGTSQEISDAAEVVARTQRQWSNEHVDRCKAKELDRALRIKVPALFGKDLPQKAPGDGAPDVGELTNLNLLISNKFHTLTNRVFDNIYHENRYAMFPYDPNAMELTIIKHFKTAAFILGRSGTGKTTCLLYKLLSRYLASRVDVTPDKEHCQILLTRSKELTKKLRLELIALIKTQVSNAIHTGAPPVEDPEKASMWNGTEEETERTLFELNKYQFPLVCTFAHFLRLIENSIRQNDKKNYAIPGRDRVTNFVDYQYFRDDYWPKLALQSGLGLHLEASVVFSEIQGVIKGSASTRNGLTPLSRDAYIRRSPNLAPVFPTPAARALVFDLYTKYENLKKQQGGEDAIDRMIKIHHGLQRYDLAEKLKDIIQEIYVDEVQDQRPLELELFLHLIKDPRGIHFAGDSAQCISNDSAFRFANVKALFFDHYITKPEHELAKPTELYKLAKPTLFALSRNYRSRQGILAFASFIMGLLWRGFSTMVDNLDPEVGEIPGPKPIIFVGAGVIDLLMEVSKLAHNDDNGREGNQRSNKQVVIVRDEGTQSELQDRLKGKRLAYTILETKGMEYDDVFIYDFFGSSPCPEEMYTTLEQLFPDQVNESYAAKNMVMCSELKNLYVAITRPCNRLWFLESRTSSAIDLLERLPDPNLVEIKYLERLAIGYSLPQLATTLRPMRGTTAEDWISTGHQCMENGLYDRAVLCYDNGGDHHNKTIAEAYMSRQSGLRQRAIGDTQAFRRLFREAARLFMEVEMFRKCVDCIEALGEYVEAAKILSSKLGDHERAAILFERAGHFEEAVSEYCNAGLPEQGLGLAYNKRLYECLINGLHCHLEGINGDLRRKWATVCNDYVREVEPETKLAMHAHLRDKAFSLFISLEEKMEYLVTHSHFAELLDFGAARGELPSTIWYLILTGHLKVVLQLSQQQNGRWKWPANYDRFLEQIYRVIKTEILFKALNANMYSGLLEPVFTIEPDILEAAWMKSWHLQIKQCRKILVTSALPSKITLDSSAMELVSVLILIKTEYFTKKVISLSQLAFLLDCLEDYVKKFLQPLELELPDFPESTTSCLGLINCTWSSETKFYCSPWSMLRQTPKGKEFSPRILLDAHKWLSSLVPIAAAKILTKAANLRILQVDVIVNYRCLKYVSQKDGSRIPTCPHAHNTFISKDAYLAQFKERVGWWQRRLRFRDICLSQRILSPSSDSDSLLSSETDLSFQQQWFFSYRSAFTQSAADMSEVVTRILHEENLRPLLQRFQALSTSYISAEIKQLGSYKGEGTEHYQNSLSNLMKGYRLLYTFYPFSSIQSQLHDILGIPNSHSAVNVIQAYNQFKRLAHSEILMNFANTVSIVYRLQKALAFALSEGSYSYDESIISLYEEIATLLLFLGWPEQVITLDSWRELYLKQWIKFLKISSHNECRTSYQYLLYRLILRFCGVVRSKYRHSEDSQPTSIQKLLTRRSVDFLLIVMLNFQNLSPKPSFYWMLHSTVQQVLSIPGLCAQGVCNSLNSAPKLLVQILQAFRCYDRKDHLCLYLREASTSPGLAPARDKMAKRLRISVHSRPIPPLKHAQSQSVRKVKCLLQEGAQMETAAILLRTAFDSRKLRQNRILQQTAAYIIFQRYQIFKERQMKLKAASIIYQRYRMKFEAASIIYQRYKIFKQRRQMRLNTASTIYQRCRIFKQQRQMLQAAITYQRLENPQPMTADDARQIKAATVIYQRYGKFKELRRVQRKLQGRINTKPNYSGRKGDEPNCHEPKYDEPEGPETTPMTSSS